MKAFMEEYGVIVVAAIVIMVIVVAASPIGESIKTGIENAVGLKAELWKQYRN